MDQGTTASQISVASQPLFENDSGLDFGCEAMDDSLTDMQWLQKMDAGYEIPGMRCIQSRKRRANVFADETAETKESCRKKLDYCSVKKGTSNKPPLSYASLIALAICSTPQRMLTLSGIYKWIENTFPFYRTPAAKAWKNSIRHNLSIRKGMFMKVYQYPPRRGNGSYWTLLADGEDELKRAIPLFSTFQPPVIDPESVYNRTPTTHTVKSRGQFIPVLPRSDSVATNRPYFSVSNSVGYIPHQEEVLLLQSSEDESVILQKSSEIAEHKVTCIPLHLIDHSYAKQLPKVYRQSPKTDDDDSINSEATVEAIFTPKRGKMIETLVNKCCRSSISWQTTNKENCRSSTGHQCSMFAMTTPSREHDISLSFLDSSLLTPLKDIVNDIEIGGPGGISLSPLYANFVSPHCGTPKRRPASSIVPSPLTPLRDPNMDSGIFTPFRPSTSLDSPSMKCSTPLKLFSPISNILPTFDTPHHDMFPSLKVTSESPNNSIRIGSLQALGLPGLTPPSLSK